jgi:RNA polymerase sigma-70 factor (ECF subfamily)
MSQNKEVNRLITMDNKIKEFENYRGLLLALAYRMMGSLSEAEDVVQDVAIKWIECDTAKIKSTKAWLIKVCSNQALDYLKKSYKKREVYSGTWLPEIIPDTLMTWESDLDKRESLNTSFLILLENLSPIERAVFILRKVFDYSSLEVCDFLDITDSNTRKIHQRACKKIDEDKRKYLSPSNQSLDILKDFFMHACNGSSEDIKELLSHESEFWSDGGGKASAINKIIVDKEFTANFFAKLFKRLSSDIAYRFEYQLVNHQPGCVLSKKNDEQLWEVETIFSFEVENQSITRIYAQRNPDKLSIMKYHLQSA